jgi:hypothetical protein
MEELICLRDECLGQRYKNEDMNNGEIEQRRLAEVGNFLTVDNQHPCKPQSRHRLVPFFVFFLSRNA